jgi:hypothetical protein
VVVSDVLIELKFEKENHFMLEVHGPVSLEGFKWMKATHQILSAIFK